MPQFMMDEYQANVLFNASINTKILQVSKDSMPQFMMDEYRANVLFNASINTKILQVSKAQCAPVHDGGVSGQHPLQNICQFNTKILHVSKGQHCPVLS